MITIKPLQTKTLLMIALAWQSMALAEPAKVLTIEECQQLARDNYPLIKQMSLLEKTTEYSLENASKGYLPQVTISGQATYQSEVTRIPIDVPNVTPLSKDQYKIYGEINQSLTDAIVIKQQKELIKANSVAEEQKYEVELYKLKDRVNQLYFGILLIDAQRKQADLLQKDINTAIEKIEVSIKNGTALKRDLNTLKADLLKAEQRITELKTGRKAYAGMLALFINDTIDETTVLQLPISQTMANEINRPELKLYELQKQGYNIQTKLINTKNLPKVGLFFQGGYGRPALNLLDNDFNAYYIGGIRLNWNLAGFYTSRNDKELITLGRNSVDVQKETFMLNTQLSLTQQSGEISKYQELIISDNEIIKLREEIKQTAESQLEFGTITANDYLIYLNATDQAKQNLALHQIQLLLAHYNHLNTSGN